MEHEIEIFNQPGIGMEVRTPGRFAMELAVEVLEHLDSQAEISVKNTGWKHGFGLEVAAWIPIHGQSVYAELMTDGELFNIRRQSGSRSEFAHLCKLVQGHLGTGAT